MGRIVTFDGLAFRDVTTGVKRAGLTGGEMKALAAEVIRLAPGAALTESVPCGSDRYLFTLSGTATVTVGGASRVMTEESFATVGEGTEITVANASAGEITLISVLAPPPGSAAPPAGFTRGLTVAARATTPVHDVPEQKKGRIYFVSEKAARSERAHAMIVQYVRDTVTGLHMHPDAESLFVLLSGKTRFTVNGEDVGAEGDGVSFLEFHVPAAYTTVKG